MKCLVCLDCHGSPLGSRDSFIADINKRGLAEGDIRARPRVHPAGADG